MATKNDITGDRISSKYSNENYLNNYDNIFRKYPENTDEENKGKEMKDTTSNTSISSSDM